MQILKDKFDYSSVNQVGLNDETKGLFVYNRFKEYDKSILLVCNSLYDSNKLYQVIKNYTDDVLLFPMDDFLTSEALAISPELKISRNETLNELINNNHKIVITNLMGYLRFLPKKEVYQKYKLTMKLGMEFDMNELIIQLDMLGYTRETLVEKTGEFASRGYVLDIFPVSYDEPVRLEFWGNEITEIKTFNINSQMTIKKLNDLTIYPNTEFIGCNETVDETVKKQYNLSKYTEVCNIFEYLNNAEVVYNNLDDILHGTEILLEEIENYKKEVEIHPEKYMFAFDDIKVTNYYNFKLLNYRLDDKVYNCSNIDVFSKNPNDISKTLNRYLKDNIVTICVHSKYIQNKIIENMPNTSFIITNEKELYKGKVNIIQKTINKSFKLDEYIFISESDLFNENNKYEYHSNFKIGSKIRNISKLQNGDYVVHNLYGLGRYLGIKTLEKGGLKKDYLLVEYSGSDKLYIPVEKIDNIYKYASSDAAIPKLNKLGTNEWKKTKLKVKAHVQEMAHELLELYAKRETTKGFAFKPDTEEQIIFENDFEYELTQDQIKAINDIKADMEKPIPMDRLLCGDVGFGKTEVAFRAIFKAIMSSKQCAILCPTTILSDQHYKNAIKRFKTFDVNVGLLNRFVTPAKQKQVIEDLKLGKIDLLIGTHKILGKEVSFKDLGLLVIDEEQRFGVTHKEKIKKYKESIDVLSLSATPIPRTLQMSLSGIRGLSLIETPPVNRFPIQTYVMEENNQIIKDAVYKELTRDGQVFIMYNNVEHMNSKKSELEKLLPEAKIVCIHGQMDRTTIENVMTKFLNKEYNCLLCTTIIETGIDIPSVNTLIIYDADRYGLSQLYQIRGRVGRSDKIAYCYLMYNHGKNLSDVATKRLSAIKDFTELGSGLSIAMRDLSIRGAGDILGVEQAGFVASVGMEMFIEMLHDEVEKINGNDKKEDEDIQPLIDVETNVPDEYVSAEELKIEIHKKINTIDSIDKLNQTKLELSDRFGTIPQTLIIYMYEELFENKARKLDINKVIQNKNSIEFMLDEKYSMILDYQDLFAASQKLTRNIRFKIEGHKLKIVLDLNNLDKHFIYYLNDLIDIIIDSLKIKKL